MHFDRYKVTHKMSKNRQDSTRKGEKVYMKGLKKILTGILAGAMALSMTISAGTAMKANAAADNTITVQSAVEGETYNIYRLLDLDTAGLATEDTTEDDAYLYTINDTWKGFWTTGAGASYITTNTVGTRTYVVWKEDMKSGAQMEAFGKAAAKYAADNGVAPSATAVTVGDDNTASWTGLENGYYMVTSTLGSAVSVASTPATKNNVISEKNQGNTTEKQVLEGNTYGSTSDGMIGDLVTFRSKVVIAKNSVNVVYHDTMTGGLTWTGAADTKVYTDEACTEELAASNYAVAAGTAPETFTVSFTKAYLDGIAEASVNLYIKYNANINDKAVVATAETNTPKITWGENGTYTGTPTETYVRKFQILKYDATDSTKKALAGAKFQLYTSANGGDAINVAVSSDGKTYRVVYEEDKIPAGYTVVTDKKMTTLDNGTLHVEGVDSVTYYLEETDAPVGYNKLTERVAVTVSADNSVIVDVPNSSGAVLPSTGGIGTTIFYIIGGLLIVAAVVFFVVRRKADAE